MAVTRYENFDLSSKNTFRMKVSCACYIEYDDAADLKTIDFASLPQPVMHIGAGSNLLFTKDFPGTVLHSGIKYIKYVDLGLEELLVAVGAGVIFDDFVAETCAHGLWGAENLSLIPGEVGAAAVQNIGAYGVEAKDIISGVVCYDTQTGEKVTFKKEQCGYGYRDSMFKQAGNKGRYIITSVLFRLSRIPKPQLKYGNIQLALGGKTPSSPSEVRDTIIRIRQEKLPDPAEKGSAGSFFKNPVISKEHFEKIKAVAAKELGEDYSVPHFPLEDGSVKVPAAWLIEQCGFKGQKLGGAAVYEKQPLVIVNDSGEAAPEEILALERKIQESIKTKYNIDLTPEVEHI